MNLDKSTVKSPIGHYVIQFAIVLHYSSDLLGQVMPLVGMDWSQTGVAHFFSAIKVHFFGIVKILFPNGIMHHTNNDTGVNNYKILQYHENTDM